MKADLIRKEPGILEFWEKDDVYNKILHKSKDFESFVLHDGPPYANGLIHLGHALNKILKDVVVKYKILQGYRCYFKPGWDCHGLPVEHQLFKEIQKSKDEVDTVEFRKMARDYALKYVELQKKDFIRLGVFGAWENSYLTLDRQYESRVLKLLAELVRRGYVYRALKPVNWCKECQTALAEAEVEYYEKKSPSIYVLFKVKQSPVPEINTEDVSFGVWTTTPWTLLGNVACAVNPRLDYVLVSCQWQKYKRDVVVAQGLLKNFLDKASVKKHSVKKVIKGGDFEGTVLEHPFVGRESKVIVADFVSSEEGTGVVHIAPGHGAEDFMVGKEYGLDILVPVDDYGKFKEEDYVPEELQGKDVYEANPLIIDILKEKEVLLYSEDISHSYPFCWRCKNPIIFRATYQYFMNVDHNSLRDKLLESIKKVQWYPRAGIERISAMVGLRPDWCLSRQRLWGVPIPSFRCQGCDYYIVDADVIEHIASLVEKEGSDTYFEKEEKELLPSGYVCPQCRGKDFVKQTDIIDVWFESGASFFSTVIPDKNLSFPADLYLEGSDQHRGWFQVSLIPSVAVMDKAPYKGVLTHGFVVDEDGRKMSKSLGNVISPQDVIKDYGADILRLWTCFSDYHQDVKISGNIISQLVDSYRKIRNTLRFILGNISDFSQDRIVPYSELYELDRWLLGKLYGLYLNVDRYYQEYAFYKIYQGIYKFCIIELSNMYFDILKDRLYTWGKDSEGRRSAQTALFYLLKFFLRVLAPLLSFTAEEAFHEAKKMTLEKGDSIFMDSWFSLPEEFNNQELVDNYDFLLFTLREEVNRELESKRQEGVIGSSLEAQVELYLPSEQRNLLQKLDSKLEWIFIVSCVKLFDSQERKIVVQKAEGKKCPRCWNYSSEVGSDRSYPDLCPRCTEVLKGGSNG